MTDATDAICWNCGKPLPALPLPVSRHEYCPHCAEPVHCCRMCVHFAPRLAEQCDGEQTEPPTDKTAANFCDFFALARRGGPDGAEAGDAEDPERLARERLDALFGGSGDSDDGGEQASDTGDADQHDQRAAAARARLDALFGDDASTDKDGD
jgi:hypothetical protein